MADDSIAGHIARLPDDPKERIDGLVRRLAPHVEDAIGQYARLFPDDPPLAFSLILFPVPGPSGWTAQASNGELPHVRATLERTVKALRQHEGR